MAICRIPEGVGDRATYLPGMRVDSGWVIMVPLLTVLGSIVGLVLSIVPRVVNRLWGRPVGRAVQATYVTAYVAIGVWVHHSLGVAYARESASYSRDLAADELICQFCLSPIDGRYAWILLWSVAGLVAYALRPGAENTFMQWWQCRSGDEPQDQAAEHWADKMLGKPHDEPAEQRVS